MSADKMVRAGNDLWLGGSGFSAKCNLSPTGNATHVAAMRRAAKAVLYTVVNSNSMNRLGSRYTSEHYAANVFSKDLPAVEKGGTVSYDAKSEVYTNYEYVLSGAPKGITINKATGKIGGTVASDAVAGKYVMTVSLKDENGFIGQAIVLNLTVNGGLSYKGATTANVIANKFARVDVSSECKGAAVSYEVQGDLPQGMALTADGAIVGTPAKTGTFNVTVVAKSAGQSDLSQSVTITVSNASTLAFTGAALDNAKEGEAYTADLATATGAQGIVYSATGLPEGMTLSADGQLTGTPVQAGDYTIKVTAWAEGCERAVTTEFTVKVEGTTTTPPEPGPGSNPESGCHCAVDAGLGLTLGVAALATAVIVTVVRKKSRNK